MIIRERQPTRLVLGACILLTACGSSGPARETAVPPPAAAIPPAAAEAPEHAHGMMQELPATAGPGYTVADVRFMQDMIGHHAQAVRMAALVPSDASESLRRLAEKIDISQRDEIAMMERWLEERGQAVPDEEHVHAMRMPGMLTPYQMSTLEAARGREFERLFLTFMIQHHRGALDMVDSLFGSPGAAQDSDIFRFATDVDADQRDEIYIMQNMLEMLEPDPGSVSG